MREFMYKMMSTSWFFQLKDKKVIKLERFYIWMSVAGFFGAFGLGHDAARGVEYTFFYYLFLAPFIIGWLLRASTIFAFRKIPKKLQDKYWETQLMRFLDPAFTYQRELYGNWQPRLELLKKLWKDKFRVDVEWTRKHAPLFLKIQIILLIGLGFLGFGLGYWIF